MYLLKSPNIYSKLPEFAVYKASASTMQVMISFGMETEFMSVLPTDTVRDVKQRFLTYRGLPVCECFLTHDDSRLQDELTLASYHVAPNTSFRIILADDTVTPPSLLEVTPEAVPPESVPPEAVPAEAVPPEAVPAEAVPPESVPPESVPPEAIPPTSSLCRPGHGFKQ